MLEIILGAVVLGVLYLKSRLDSFENVLFKMSDEYRDNLKTLNETIETKAFKHKKAIVNLEAAIERSGDLTRDRIDYHLAPSDEQKAAKEKLHELRVKTWS